MHFLNDCSLSVEHKWRPLLSFQDAIVLELLSPSLCQYIIHIHPNNKTGRYLLWPTNATKDWLRTLRKSVAVIITTKASARSSIRASSASLTCAGPTPAERFSVCVTSMRCSIRKRRPCTMLWEPRLTMAAPMMRATEARRL